MPQEVEKRLLHFNYTLIRYTYFFENGRGASEDDSETEKEDH